MVLVGWLDDRYERSVRAFSSRPHQAICPGFARADELDVAGKAKRVELALDGLEATTELAGDVRRTHLA